MSIGGGASPGRRVFANGGSEVSASLVGRTELAPKTWRHSILVRDGKRVTVFLNGRREPESSGELEPGHVPGVDHIFFGGPSDNFTHPQGRMSDIAVFRRTLTAPEIPRW